MEKQPIETDDAAAPAGVLECDDVDREALRALLDRYGLELCWIADGADIPGSHWGAPEAGLIGSAVFVRRDTPVHSLLHEACHAICMGDDRRRVLHTDAGGDDAEENAVCYLQILLADKVPGVGRQRLMEDMDRWGYSFRLGSTQAWFEGDAEDACEWLLRRGLIDGEGTGTLGIGRELGAPFRSRSRVGYRRPMEVFETPIQAAELPTGAGSYVLEFELAAALTLRPGRLGTVRLGPGRVRYYGSARGPGGLRARVGRHLRTATRKHWHVDALTAQATVARILIDHHRSEHDLVREDLESASFEVAIPGFGSSDCGSCPSHLLIEPIKDRLGTATT